MVGPSTRDIAGNHMFGNGNKRTAVAAAVVQLLMERNNVMSGPSEEGIWSVVSKVADSSDADHAMDIGKIAFMLRGY